MTAERWRQIEEIYESVTDASPLLRNDILLEACGEDDALRREVESLVQASEGAGDFLSLNELHQHIRELSLPEAKAELEKTAGRFKILSVIGSGGMGNVYLALDEELNRRVALKILPAQFASDEERIARFRREARAASALNHPNIVTVFDVGRTGDTWYIATEFIEGVTLRTRLEQGTMSTDEALNVAVQCAAALEAAHKASILHRDVKPENLLLRPDGLVKIVDFGLARSLKDRKEAAENDATRTGAVFGTPRYMSPEQARAQHLDTRTDIFSLGAVTYEMIAGRPAFAGTTAAEIFANLLDAEPKALTSRGLNFIVQKALAKDRGVRYQTVADFAVDLKRFGESPTAFSDAVRRPQRTRFSRRVLLSGTAGTLAAGFAAYQFRPRTSGVSTADAPSMSATPLTTFAGLKDFGSLSPDEERLVFSWNGGHGGSGGKQERNIYVKSVDGSETVQLTATAKDHTHPAWSPDGRFVAFCSVLDSRTPYAQFGVYIVPATGGEQRRVAQGGEGVSWSPDGKSLAVAGMPPESGGIFQLSLETGQQTRLTHSLSMLDELPVFSPDGKWIVFTRSLGSRARELFVVPTTGGRERQITFDHQPTFGAAWTSDGKEIVFSSNRGGGGESLWRISPTGGTPRRISATLEGAFYPSISRKTNQLVYTESFADTNVYRSEGAGFNGRAVPGHFTGPRPLITSSRRDDSPSISPQEDRIAFVSRRTGNEEIWVCNLDGTRATQLTSFKGPATGTPRWSPDGRWLTFDSIATNNPDIYVIRADGGPLRRVTAGPAGSFMPSWSADGKQIYFKSDRSGQDQIWSVPFEGGAAVQITNAGGCEALASPDGKLLYYTQRSWGCLWSVPVGGGIEKPVPELQRYDQIFRSWGVVRKGIYFMSREQARTQTLRFFSFETRQVSSLLSLETEPIWNYPNVALSNDGKRLLTVRLDQEVNDLMVIENFR